MPLDHYVTLGRSGLRVSPFALGAMTFGEDEGGAGSSVEESEKILATYLDRGGNFVDTANFYTNGHSEKILGDWFAAHPGRRDRVVLASKFFTNMYPGDPNGGGAGRSSIIAPAARDAAPAADRLPGPVLAAQLGPPHAHRGDAADAGRPRPRGHDPLHRVLQHARLGDRTGSDDRRAARLDAADRAAGRVLAAGPHGGGRTRTAGARPGYGAGAVEPVEERLPLRQVPARRRGQRLRARGLRRRPERRRVRGHRRRRGDRRRARNHLCGSGTRMAAGSRGHGRADSRGPQAGSPRGQPRRGRRDAAPRAPTDPRRGVGADAELPGRR